MKKGYIGTKSDTPEMKPTLYVDATDLPQLKDWKVGSEYDLVLKVKMTSQSISNYEGKGKTSGSFEVLKVEPK